MNKAKLTRKMRHRPGNSRKMQNATSDPAAPFDNMPDQIINGQNDLDHVPELTPLPDKDQREELDQQG